MKNIIYIVLLGGLIFGCTTTKKANPDTSEVSKNSISDTIKIANDALEYEIIIIEPGFNSWLITQKPRNYYSESYLENKNRLYVSEYNTRVIQPQRYDANIYEMQINYNQSIHYGLEVNYLLYHYFLFLEQRYNQKFIFTRG